MNRNIFDLRVEGTPWVLSVDANYSHQSIQAAFINKHEFDDDLMFLIRKNDTGEEQFFCINYVMWQALCESPSIMVMYLSLGWDCELG
jgi:hypothetical protein